jgi:hypothetical protein
VYDHEPLKQLLLRFARALPEVHEPAMVLNRIFDRFVAVSDVWYRYKTPPRATEGLGGVSGEPAERLLWKPPTEGLDGAGGE